MWSYCLTAWYSGFRGRSFHAVFAFTLLLLGVAYLGASFSARQPQTVALDIGFSAVRFSLVLMSLFWVQELVGKELERKTILFALTYPRPRSDYLLGRYFGIISLLALATLVLGVALLLITKVSTWGYSQPYGVLLGGAYWLALFGLWLDACVVTAFCLAISSVATSAILPFAVGACFAIAAKMLGPVAGYLARGAEGDADLVASYGTTLDTLLLVIPDLSRLDWRELSLYQQALPFELIAGAIVMAVAYIAILLSVAALAFRQREFS